MSHNQKLYFMGPWNRVRDATMSWLGDPVQSIYSQIWLQSLYYLEHTEFWTSWKLRISIVTHELFAFKYPFLLWFRLSKWWLFPNKHQQLIISQKLNSIFRRKAVQPHEHCCPKLVTATLNISAKYSFAHFFASANHSLLKLAALIPC